MKISSHVFFNSSLITYLVIIYIGYCLINYTFPYKNIGKGKITRLFLIIGVNWIWFNCYIGLIAANTLIFMIMRAGLDVLAMLVGGLVAEWIIQKQKVDKTY